MEAEGGGGGGDLQTKRVKKALLVFLLPFTIYLLSWVGFYFSGLNLVKTQSDDLLPATYLPISILKDGDFYLDEFFNFFLSRQGHGRADMFYVREVNGHWVSLFPVATAVLAVPFYILPVALQVPVNSLWYIFTARVAAAFLASLSGLFVYLALKQLTREREALVLTFLYAFGTGTFALSSQGLWQHAPTQLLLAVAVWILIRGLTEDSLVGWAGLVLSLACVVRYTNLVPTVFLTAYVLAKHPNRFVRYCLMALPPVILQLLYNQVYLGSFLETSYGSEHFSLWTGPFPEGFLGIWFSPSKGLLPYSPIFIFSLLGAGLVWVRGWKFPYAGLFRWLSLSVLGLTLLMGKWYRWFGGWAFGYRTAVDMVPFLIFLMVPVVESGWWKKLKVPVVALSVWSVLIQIMGVAFYDGEWHAAFDRGVEDSGWLWSLRNSEMRYYWGKIQTKLGRLFTS